MCNAPINGIASYHDIPKIFAYIYRTKIIMSLSLLDTLVEYLSELPGIGKKTALRLALEIIRKDQMYAYNLAQCLIDITQSLKKCTICGSISERETCYICASPTRNHQIICVVEDYQDVLAIENTNTYDGVYHLLGGLISPINGIGPSQLNIELLIERIQKENITEIIMALNSTMEGEATTFYLCKKIQAVSNVRITTLARGIAVGEDLNYIDEITLSRSILNRVPLNT